MRDQSYIQIALAWRPDANKEMRFALLATGFVFIMLCLGIVIDQVDVPERPRAEKSKIPERVAKFVAEKPKPKPKPPEPKPKPPEPKPKPPEPKVEVPEDKPKVVRKKEPEKKPLTETQKKAREVAEKSGLLALSSELSDLMDTSDVSKQVQGTIKKSEGAKEVAGVSADVLTANASKGSGGVNSAKYATQAGTTQLSAQELAAARAALTASEDAFEKSEDPTMDAAERATIRSTEEVTLVIDRHKSSLQRVYDRARRKNPSLKGKLVLELTIAPDGSVEDVRIVSSELNDASLEQQLVARIKNLKFGAKNVPTVKVKYPIEFLPN